MFSSVIMGYLFVLLLFSVGCSCDTYTVVGSTYCDGPDVADVVEGVSTATECYSLCDGKAGCVNALYSAATTHCYLRAQCEDTYSQSGYDLYRRDLTENTQCYWEGLPGYTGAEYMGTVSTTVNGLTCQRWDTTSPHDHTFDASPFLESTLSAAENYCRNPDGEWAPWCYTTDPGYRWEFCDVPICKPYTAGYAMLQNADCPGNDITTVLDLSLEGCQQLCTSLWNCVAAVVSGTQCVAKSLCSKESTTGKDIYVKMGVICDTRFYGHPIGSTSHVTYPFRWFSQNALDAFWNRIAILVLEDVRTPQTNALIDKADVPVGIYAGKDFPGWSTYAHKDCAGNDIAYYSLAPLTCAQKCIEEPECVAILVHPDGTCLPKRTCNTLTVNSPDWNIYRILDRDVSGYSVTNGVSLQAHDEQEGIENGESYSVSEVWQCAAWCRRYQANCACFEVQQNLSVGGFNCFIKSSCDSANFVAGQSDIYSPSDFSTTWFQLSSETWCSNSADVATDYPSVPTAGECVSLCRHRDNCFHAVYDFYRKVCYLKASCDSTQFSIHHDLYTKEEGEWTEWSGITSCGELVQGQLSRQRECVQGAYCVGESVTCVQQCERSYDARPGWRLPTYIVRSETVTSLTACLALCLENCQCHSVNYRVKWQMDTHHCEVLEIPSGLDTDSLLTFAPDYTHLYIVV